jgi:hypothetical protein
MKAPEGWTDTPEQAQIRSCLTAILQQHEDTEVVRVAGELINLMRDQLLMLTANTRRKAAESARTRMSTVELALASNQSRQTISRLLTEAKALT